MRPLRVISVIFLFLGASVALLAQTWTPLTNQPNFRTSTSLLLTDGRVLAQDTDASDYWTLTPDPNGSYANGTWSQVASLPQGYGPLYYASAVLPDGRVVVMGGEYNLGSPQDTTLGAIYDPQGNTWTSLAAPSGWITIGDGQSVVLADGTFMLANCCTKDEALLDANTLAWTPTGYGKADINDEEGWTLLPNGDVLTIDTESKRSTASEIYDPATGSWFPAGSTIAKLVRIVYSEIGPAVLRPDGTVLATGATAHNAVYDSTSGVWSPAPDFPKNRHGQQLDIVDGPAALLPDGNVLCMTSPGVYHDGAVFFEWDGANFNETVNIPHAASDSSYMGRMLVLPTGQIMFTDGSHDVELYTSAGVPNPSWAPTITKFTKNLVHGKASTLSGTQFNGLSQGAAYGDDAQMATNYPLVRITNNATGHVFYARTYQFSTMAIATGSKIVKTHFQVPAGIEIGASQLEVVANGIPSSPVNVMIR
jgi:Kelch motif